MSKHKPVAASKAQDPSSQLDLRPGQSIELLKELHILTREGKLNQDSRRKLKQVYHLFQFIEKLLKELPASEQGPTLADHGAGKSYLGFIIYDLFFKGLGKGSIYGIETRSELVASSQSLAQRLGFDRMKFLNLSVAESAHSAALPDQMDVVTALHACDTATDFALHTGIRAGASIILTAPCCHKQIRPQMQLPPLLKPMLQHGVHLGQQAEMVTDSLRALLLEANGYDAQVFEFVALEHTSKNKMILAVRRPAGTRVDEARRAQVLGQIAEIKAFYGIHTHCLESLLQADAAPA